MKRIVSAKEITGNPGHKSIIFFINSTEDICKPKILAYLKSGDIVPCASHPSKATDIISGKTVCDENIFYTDGEYIWSREEIYYIEKYNLMPDEEFVKKLGIDGKEKYRARKHF